MKPACMSDEDYAAWTKRNDTISAGLSYAEAEYYRAETPCWDCTLGHAADMRMLGKCDGIPGEPIVKGPPEKHGHAAYFARKHAQMLDNIARACELLDSGMTQTAAAKVMSVSPSAVSKWSRMREEAA